MLRIREQATEIRDHLNRLSRDPDFIAAVGAIRPGRFRRDPANPDYRARLKYTEEIRRFVYDPALMDVVLSDEELKEQFFRTFGYKGQMRFRIYPNCWIRDLPLLDFGEDVYLGDGIVLGTNQVSSDQKFLAVGEISVGSNSVFNQQCMVGYGTRIGKSCTLEVRVMVGMNVSIGSGSHLRTATTIAHHCRLGERVVVGYAAMVGAFSIVDDGVELPDYTNVPQFSHVTSAGIMPRRRGKE